MPKHAYSEIYSHSRVTVRQLKVRLKRQKSNELKARAQFDSRTMLSHFSSFCV